MVRRPRLFFLKEKIHLNKLLFSVTKDKRIDLSEKQTSRNVFFCRLIGPRNAGKSSFMRRFIGKTGPISNSNHNQSSSSDSIYNSYVINSIPVYGQ